MTTIALPQVPPLEQHTGHPHIMRVDGIAMLRGSRLPVRLVAQQYRAVLAALVAGDPGDLGNPECINDLPRFAPPP